MTIKTKLKSLAIIATLGGALFGMGSCIKSQHTPTEIGRLDGRTYYQTIVPRQISVTEKEGTNLEYSITISGFTGNGIDLNRKQIFEYEKYDTRTGNLIENYLDAQGKIVNVTINPGKTNSQFICYTDARYTRFLTRLGNQTLDRLLQIASNKTLEAMENQRNDLNRVESLERQYFGGGEK